MIVVAGRCFELFLPAGLLRSTWILAKEVLGQNAKFGERQKNRETSPGMFTRGLLDWEITVGSTDRFRWKHSESYAGSSCFLMQ